MVSLTMLPLGISIGCKLFYLEFLARRDSEEEKDLQEVYFSWSGPGPVVGYAGESDKKLFVFMCWWEQLMELMHARARRRFRRGLKRKPMALVKKLRKAKKEAPPNEKPEIVKTHLRNMIIVPEMVGSIVGVYNGKTFNQVEVKPEMIGHYLGEFSVTYKPVKHGRPGIGATHSSRFIPLK
ncbi:hypothetical protein Cfor_11632 [Coptotermes formosanus]|uniref:40S ribosomal protein S15 n=2 Tax=Arthropoda TaxID=6656 RepID=A0A6L2Q7N2_COPFO|nr:hypothetical protein Cfor_11632 [Coptotermes formosanus]